ncbi:MAG: uncharacterized protein PWR27_20 [Petroclostridium sp.]|jgi:hypothetical protein|nr:uncharacterized protein [Petroclostridium sp.]
MNGEKDTIEKRGYKIDCRKDGVFLTILPFTQSGTILDVTDILNFIEKKQIKNYNKDVILEAFEKSDGLEYKIAEAQGEFIINATIKVKVSDNKMKATIVVIPPEGGAMLSSKEIISILNNEKIVFGLDYNTIDTISKFPVYNQEILIAQGIEPVNGENGRMEYHFELSKDRTPKLLEDGRVDFRQLDLIENVHAGDVLITAIPPTPGTPGKNVFGEEVPAIPGKPVVLPKGKNVEISEDGQKLLASIDGQVVVADKKVNVYAIYEVSGNVDNSVGNIDFVGNVVVKGNVLTGFSIEAGGTVEVQGVVEGAVIKAKGDIILHRGMQGLNKGVLVAGGSIVSKYIEHSNLTAAGDIKCEAIMHSNVQCGGTLELGGKKGLIVGGTAKARKEIIAKVVGSPMATVTELEVGADPAQRERYKALKEEIATTEGEIKKADQAIELLKKLEALNKLDDAKRVILMKSIKTKLYLSNKLNKLKNEFVEIERKLDEEGNGKIKVQNIIYPGVKITIGSSMMYVKENIKYATLYRDGAEIRIGQYEK